MGHRFHFFFNNSSSELCFNSSILYDILFFLINYLFFNATLTINSFFIKTICYIMVRPYWPWWFIISWICKKIDGSLRISFPCSLFDTTSRHHKSLLLHLLNSLCVGILLIHDVLWIKKLFILFILHLQNRISSSETF